MSIENEEAIPVTVSENGGNQSVLNELDAIEAGLESGADFVPGPEVSQGESPKGPEKTGLGSMIVMVTSMLCERMAAATGLDEMKMTQPESEGLDEAIEAVAEMYDLGGNAWLGLALMSGAVVAPRYMMMREYKAARGAAENGEKSQHGAGE